MALVLAIEPDPAELQAIRQLARDMAGHEFVHATSGEDAIALVRARVPDLIVFPLVLPAAEESALRARIAGIIDQHDVQTLTIPLQAAVGTFGPGRGAPSGSSAPRWFYWFKPVALTVGGEACDGSRLADEIQQCFGLPERSSLPMPGEVDAAAAPEAFTPEPARHHAADDDVDGGDDLDADEDADDLAVAAAQSIPPRSSLAARIAPVGRAARGALRAIPVARMASASRSGVAAVGRAGAALLSTGAGAIRAGGARLLSAVRAAGARASSNATPAVAAPYGTSAPRRRLPLRKVIVAASIGVVVGTGITYSGSIFSLIEPAESTARAATGAAEASTAIAKPIGRLRVTSTPDGASVVVGGTVLGRTPLSLDEMTPGTYDVTIVGASGAVDRRVTVRADQTASVDVAIYPGWAALFAPFELKVSEKGRVLRMDDDSRVMLSPGRHELELVNDAVGFREVQTLDITPGEVTAYSVVPPKTTLTLSATPAAQVWIDGARAGETPIVELPLDVGTHEVVLRHDTTVRRLVLTATVAPVTLDVDLTAAGQ